MTGRGSALSLFQVRNCADEIILAENDVDSTVAVDDGTGEGGA